MTQPKFIITSNGNFRLGMVSLHKDLLQGNEQCWGGGYYEFDFTRNRLILSGESYDFGRPRWEWIDTLKVPSTYRGLSIVYVPEDPSAEDFVVTDELNVSYVD
jgi:hypothetical protein